MSKICRLCLRPIPSESAIMLYRSFNATMEAMDMVNWIEKYLEIKVEHYDLVSTAICQACYYNLEEIHSYYKCVAEKQLTLQNDLMEANIKKESCVDDYGTEKTDEPAALDCPTDIIINDIDLEDECDQDVLQATYMENNKCPKFNDTCVCGHIFPKIGKHDRKNFNATVEAMDMVNWIEKYLEIKVEHYDFLSTAICQACFYRLEEFHTFCKCIAEKQLTLQNDFTEANIQIESCGDDYGTEKPHSQVVMSSEENLRQDEPAVLDYPMDIIKNEIDLEDECAHDMLQATYMKNNKCPKLNNFCYVCGHIVPKIGKQDRKNLLTAEFKTAYCLYFGETDLSGANFTPNTVCKSCYNTLISWIHGKSAKFSFMKPVIWVEDLTGHDESRCYACINSRHGLNRKQLKTKVYTAAFTATLPVKRAADIDPPKPPGLETESLGYWVYKKSWFGHFLE